LAFFHDRRALLTPALYSISPSVSRGKCVLRQPCAGDYQPVTQWKIFRPISFVSFASMDSPAEPLVDTSEASATSAATPAAAPAAILPATSAPASPAEIPAPMPATTSAQQVMQIAVAQLQAKRTILINQ